MSENDGGPAFPRYEPSGGNVFDGPIQEVRYAGMTLRDYFAAQAFRFPDVRLASLFSHRWAAEIAYVVADAMLEARAK